MLVEDHDDARELLAIALRSAGANVTEADSVAVAVDALQRDDFSVLVSDIGMPEEDGFSLIRKVRALPGGRGSKLPAVALTAYARGEDRAAALRAGFNGHVAKPIEPSELVAVIASLCGRFA